MKFVKYDIPDMPEDEKEQIKMVWSAVFNHLPHRLWSIEFKQRFVLVIVGLILALVGVMTGLLAMCLTN